MKGRQIDMKPTDTLIEEHKTIKIGLSCLERLAGNAVDSGKLDSDMAHKLIDFLKNYADKFHHAKEEAELFPVMKRKPGFKGGCSPVVVLIREHELGRCYIDGMKSHIEEAAAGDEEGLRWFSENAQSYLKLLRDHIKKEDYCLFPQANKVLEDSEQESLRSRFEAISQEQPCETYVQGVTEIAAELGVG